MRRLRLAVLVSGGGSNLKAILDACEAGRVDAEVACVIIHRKAAFALERAKAADVEGVYIGQGNYPDPFMRSEALLKALRERAIDLVVLAGYLNVLPESVVSAFDHRIINIHPSLIPRHCGPGFYGSKVHASVLASKDSESGATVHFVDVGVDTGKVIRQVRVPVYTEDTVESLSERVLKSEHHLMVQVIKEIAEGSIAIGEEAKK